jgi:hypothetical protein
MAYQSLNIIGSFMAGIPAVNREIGEERARVQQAHQESAEDVAAVEVNTRTFVSEDPHDRRNPYYSMWGSTSKNAAEEPEETPESEAPAPGSIGSNLDVVI